MRGVSARAPQARRNCTGKARTSDRDRHKGARAANGSARQQRQSALFAVGLALRRKRHGQRPAREGRQCRLHVCALLLLLLLLS